MAPDDDFQSAMRDAVRGLVADERVAGRRQSQTLRNMLRGSLPVCLPLEKVLAEAINTSVPDDRVLAVSAALGRETRRLLEYRKPSLIVMAIEDAYEREAVTQGETDVRQMRAIARRNVTTLMDAWEWITRHIAALRLARYATEQEMWRRFATVPRRAIG